MAYRTGLRLPDTEPSPLRWACRVIARCGRLVPARRRGTLARLAAAGRLVAYTLPQHSRRPMPAAPAPARYIHESWTVEDGLPVNAISALVQSRDGCIWAATWDGLARFDGVRFTVFNSANAGLPSNRGADES